MKNKSRWIMVGAVAALAALLIWAFAPKPLAVDTALVVQGPFELSVEEEGKTRLNDRFVVSAPLAGRLSRISLREGDRVSAGAVLATLSPLLSPMLDQSTRAAQLARVKAAQAAQKRAAARSEGAKLAIAQVLVELRRDEQLAKEGFIADIKLESNRLAARAAQKALEAAQQEHLMASHDLEQAQAALGGAPAAADGRLPLKSDSGFELRTPVAGRVLRVLQPSEGVVALGTPVIELGDLSGLEVVAQLLTADSMQTPPGTPVRIERWGGASPLQGQVLRVEPSAFTKVSALGVEEQRVNVHIQITSPPALWQQLGDGFSVTVALLVLQAEQALKVPSSAIFPLPGVDAQAKAVFLVEGGRARQVAVKMQAHNGREAWITEGLQAGQRVVVYPPAALQDGAKVQDRREAK